MSTKGIPESKFAMWRACVATVHLDGVVSVEEEKWLENQLIAIPFSDDQLKILINDFKKPVDFDDIFDQITEKKDRAYVLHYLRVISHIDGVFDEAEKIKYAEIEQKILGKLNLKDIEADAKAREIASYHEDKVYKTHNKSSLFESAFRSIQKLINPGDYRFPDK